MNPFKFDLYNEKPDILFLDLKKYIFNYPSFNLSNQTNLNPNIKKQIDSVLSKENKPTIGKLREKEIFCKNKRVFDELFESILSNKKYKDIFVNEIQKIQQIMNEIIYTHPYHILFGRINIEKPKQKGDDNSKIDIDENF